MNRFTNILCAVDFDDSAPMLLEFAREVAMQSNAALSVLHVAPLPLNATEFSPIPLDPCPVWEKAARARLEKLAAAHLEGRGAKYKIETRSGEAAQGILAHAREINADLIVLATHGRKGLAHLVIGSVTERVIRGAEQPVLVVKPNQPAAHRSERSRT